MNGFHSKIDISQERYKNYIFLFVMNACIIISVYYIYIFIKHYSIDWYMYTSNGDMGEIHLQSSRIVSYLIYTLFKCAGINYTRLQALNLIVHSIGWCFFVSKFVYQIAGNIHFDSFRSIAIIDIALLYSFINPATLLHTYYFSEVALEQTIGCLCLFVSIFLTTVKRKKTVLSTILTSVILYLALSTYQPYIGLFIGYTMIDLISSEKGKWVHKGFYSLIIGGVASVLSVVTGIIINYSIFNGASDRAAASLDRLVKNFCVVLENQIRIWVKGDLFLPPFFMVVLMSISIILVYLNDIALVRGGKRRAGKLFMIKMLEFIICVIIIWCVSFAPLIVSTDCILVVRAYPGIFTIVSLVGVFSANQIQHNKKAMDVYGLFLAFGLFIIGFSLVSIQVNTVASNRLDEYEIHMMISYIEDYEKETGSCIQNIKLGYDENETDAFVNEIDYLIGDTHLRGTSVAGCMPDMLRFYSDRGWNVEWVQKEEIQQKFGTVDYTYLDLNKQMVFEQDTAYLLIY
ncbi:MAG: glucosyltransferase domain-containing protein [Lachnospiraceae bacterium]|nr:glucosyltransferase domain-containing protein [Lachnospiraceae bacterium]